MDATTHKCRTFAYNQQRGYWCCTECGALEVDEDGEYDENWRERKTCPHCDGTGRSWDGILECEYCNGEGYKWWL